MRFFVLLSLMFIGFLSFNKNIETNIDDVSLLEMHLINDFNEECDNSHNLYLEHTDIINNNKVCEPTIVYNFYSRIWTNHSRINHFLSQEALFYLKNLSLQKYTSNIFQLLTTNKRSISLYKLFNPCDFYTYHNHRIII